MLYHKFTHQPADNVPPPRSPSSVVGYSLLEELVARMDRIEKTQGTKNATDALEDVDGVLEQVEQGRKAGVLGMILRRVRELEEVSISARILALEAAVKALKEAMGNTDATLTVALEAALSGQEDRLERLGARLKAVEGRMPLSSISTHLQTLEDHTSSHSIDVRFNEIESNWRRFQSKVQELNLGTQDFVSRLQTIDDRVVDINLNLESIGSQLEDVDSRLGSLEDEATREKDELSSSSSYRLQALISEIVSLALEQEGLIATKATSSQELVNQLDAHDLRIKALESHNRGDLDRHLHPFDSVETIQALLSVADLSPTLSVQLRSLGNDIQTLHNKFKHLSSTVTDLTDTTVSNGQRIASSEISHQSLSSIISSHTERSNALQSYIDRLWKSWGEASDAHVHALLAADLLTGVLSISGLSTNDTLGAATSREIISHIEARLDTSEKTTAMRRAIVSQLTNICVLNGEIQNRFREQVAKLEDDDVEGALAAVLPMIVGLLNGLIANQMSNPVYPGPKQAHFRPARVQSPLPPGIKGYWSGGKWIPYQ